MVRDLFKSAASDSCTPIQSLTRSGNPLDERAVVQDRRLGQRLDVDEVQATPFVAEEQLLGRLVQLEPVDLRVVAHLVNIFSDTVKM